MWCMFRKMSKIAKQNWCCNKCKFPELNGKMKNFKCATVLKSNETHVLSNELFKSLKESINFTN